MGLELIRVQPQRSISYQSAPTLTLLRQSLVPHCHSDMPFCHSERSEESLCNLKHRPFASLRVIGWAFRVEVKLTARGLGILAQETLHGQDARATLRGLGILAQDVLTSGAGETHAFPADTSYPTSWLACFAPRAGCPCHDFSNTLARVRETGTQRMFSRQTPLIPRRACPTAPGARRPSCRGTKPPRPTSSNRLTPQRQSPPCSRGLCRTQRWS